ncbi:aminopeptidase P family protein [Parvularcula sp. ZS-1/3]|uniref:Aminopeptidase P family protein n=1 Tax=Parvularcula mediterranea TaxID=2732508 RepID=A0A7Y3RNJ0_9PROT|nr:M24 family metallopeptidase [Parvularcula mediterranea]NNU17245.1 aminopeptidase P family protein [Parvularcula mediterranea]
MLRQGMIGGLMALGLASAPAFGEGATTGERAERPRILSMQERAEQRDAWLAERLDALIPTLMRERGIDMWIMVAREYNEDPVVETMLPARWISARRRTILVFHDDGKRVERLTVARYPMGELFPSAWVPEEQPDQWARLAEIIAERDPETIGLNTSSLEALADGMSHTQYTELVEALPKKYNKRVVSAEALALDWLETRVPSEMAVYPGVVRIAHDIIDEAFSSRVIEPGVTTADDVRWWMRDKVNALGMKVWFHPSVQIQRPNQYTPTGSGQSLPSGDVIQPGDLLWVDFGITYLGLNTDTQQHAYVLKPGETEAPKGLRDGLAALNRTTDHLTDSFEVGLTSNEVLGKAREAALADGLRPSFYSHGIGYHGHGGGSPIGWWDDQGTDHPQGMRKMRADTAWSIELNTTVTVPEWDGQDVEFRAEEDAYFDGETVRYLDGRQTKLHLITSD